MDITSTATALLVDDDPSSRNANQVRLQGQGYLVIVAENAAEALRRVKQSAPRVIFVHLVAARDNLALIQALRADDSCRHIPVVVVTNHLDPRTARTKLKTVQRAAW